MFFAFILKGLNRVTKIQKENENTEKIIALLKLRTSDVSELASLLFTWELHGY